jgi:hypothetical protein
MTELKVNKAVRQIKSKERVAEHGEVFTDEREVNAMLDLVKDESSRIESRFLEPACGNGNFVIEVLNRKLVTVRKKYGRSPSDYEKFSIIAVSSIYGVDILEDNVKECRKRLYDFWNRHYTEICGSESREEVRKAAKYIIRHNILHGDALTMLKNNGEPIVFAQWDLVIGNKLQRLDYRLDSLMRTQDEDQMELDFGMQEWNTDRDADTSISEPVRKYPLVNYWEVQKCR